MSTARQSSGNRGNSMTQGNIDSFKGGYSQVTLPAGTALFRFARARFPYSDCWMDGSTFVPLINGIQRAGYQRSESNKRNEIRNRLAIKEAWNPLTHRVKIVLKEPIVAYKGAIGPQSTWISKEVRVGKSSGSNEQREKKVEWRMGGHTQFVIPFFKESSFLKNPKKFVDMPVFQSIFKHVY